MVSGAELAKRQLYFAHMTMANPTLLIAGFGDIGERVARRLSRSYAVNALIRKPERGEVARDCGANVVVGDLAVAPSLGTMSFDTVFHFAPPPATGKIDAHTANLLAALSAAPPKRFIYISTTGVYGDSGGEWVDEDTPVKPQTDRAIRRVDAETRLQDWASKHSCVLTILRAPGIYAIDRLPIARIQAGTPAIVAAEDSYTNHIHADDLASACIAAMALVENHTINVVDDSVMKMGDYFDLVADHFGLPRPPRVSRAEAESRVAAPMLSFMRESRRIRNSKMKAALGLELRYPTVGGFLKTLGG
jgi:nucleoside-diphosphate-sugar epimerase